MVKKSKVSIVIPTLNEEKSIGSVLDGLEALADEIIVVDGHSSDRTVDEVKKRKVILIYDDKGKGSALRAGFKLATGDIIISMDADEANNKSEINDIISRIEEGYDVCMPSRFMRGGISDDITPLRVVGNNFYKFWVKLIWGVSYTDICYGFRGFRRKALAQLDLKADGFDIETEIGIKTAKRRLKYIEIPSHEGKRLHGSGKLTFWTSLILDKRILIELFSR